MLGLLLSAVVQTAGSVEKPLSAPPAVPESQRLDAAVERLNQYFQQPLAAGRGATRRAG